MGILLVVALLMTGRLIRHRMLITPDGAWREHLWLDELVLAPGDAEAMAHRLADLARSHDKLQAMGRGDR